MSRSLLAGLVAVLAALLPAAVAHAAPTLTFDRPCYSPGDRIGFTGTGFTPGGLELTFRSLSTDATIALAAEVDPAGVLESFIPTPDPEAVLAPDAYSGLISVTASQPGLAGSAFRFSRWEVLLQGPGGGRVRAAKPMKVTAVGYTHARGERLYLHYLRAGRRVKTLRLGRLAGDCGDRTTTLPRALPRGLRTGRYRLEFNASSFNAPREPGYWYKLRLR
jgi:hypothetical protein